MAVISLVQHVASATNSTTIGAPAGNAYTFTLPNAVQAGNCLILGLTYPHGAAPTTVSDSVNGTWGAASVTNDAGVGNYVAALYIFPNAGAGVTKWTITFSGAQQPVQYTISEFCNIATSSPLNNTKAALSVAGTTVATGSFTPTNNNDANGGNLIYNYCSVSALANDSPSLWTAGGSFTLLDADICGFNRGSNAFPHASEYWVQAAQAAVNPSFTIAGDAVDQFNCVAIALEAAAAGAAAPAFSIAKVLHHTCDSTPATLPVQAPATGNLRVVTCSNSNLSGVADNDAGSSWVKVTTTTSTSIWYSQGRSAKSDLKITFTITATSNASFRFYDIQGAATTAFDATANAAFGNLNNLTTASGPTITPVKGPGVIIAALLLGHGPGLDTTSPVGAIWDLVHYTGETDTDYMDNADGNSHLYYTSISASTFTWSITSNPANNGDAIAASFIQASSGTGFPTTIVIG
jgi:hypothetical protein